MDYIGILSGMLGGKRLHHSLCVEKRAIELAELHGVCTEQARLAGLLHDICHDIPKQRQLSYLAEHGVKLEAFYEEHPALWHAICGAEYLERELGVADSAIINAVRYHTTGRGNMTALEKVVFLADGTSEDRDYPGAEERRSLANDNLDRAMLEFLSFEIARLAKEKRSIVREAWEAYNYFIALTIPTIRTGSKKGEE